MDKVKDCSKYGEREKINFSHLKSQSQKASTYTYAFNKSFPTLLSSIHLTGLTNQCLENNAELKSKYGINTIKYCSCFVNNIEDRLSKDPKQIGSKLTDSFVKTTVEQYLTWLKDK